LELGDVSVDRRLEAAVGAIFSGGLVERLLAGRRVETLGERLALAALVAVPHLGGEVAVHQPADVERQRLQRIGRALRAAALRLRLAVAVSTAEQIGEPAVAATFNVVCGSDRRGPLAAARQPAPAPPS